MNISKELAIEILETAKKDGKKVVFTNGCFDILHRGHVTYLNEAKRQGDILVVGVNSDASVKKLKGESRPINSEYDRAFVLDGLKAVDYTVIFGEDTPEDLIACLKPSVHVKGGDYKKEDLPETKIVESYGGKVVILNFVEGKSTTNIINKINEK
nr:D-glycero-beta-D-manno-heptose 1-phosphate adenylyltransferase [uncultured Fusobacterium sp.]